MAGLYIYMCENFLCFVYNFVLYFPLHILSGLDINFARSANDICQLKGVINNRYGSNINESVYIYIYGGFGVRDKSFFCNKSTVWFWRLTNNFSISKRSKSLSRDRQKRVRHFLIISQMRSPFRYIYKDEPLDNYSSLLRDDLFRYKNILVRDRVYGTIDVLWPNTVNENRDNLNSNRIGEESPFVLRFTEFSTRRPMKYCSYEDRLHATHKCVVSKIIYHFKYFSPIFGILFHIRSTFSVNIYERA